MSQKITVLPIATPEVMEKIHGKLTWCNNWDSSIPTSGDTGADSDGTQEYKTTLQANEDHILDGLTGYSMVETLNTPVSGVDESLEWEQIEDVEQVTTEAA